MQFERSFNTEAWRVLRIYCPYALIAVLGEYVNRAALPLLNEYLGGQVGFVQLVISFVIWVLLAYVVHAEILLSESREKRFEPKRILGFVLRVFARYPVAILFFSVVLAIGLAFGIGGLATLGLVLASAWLFGRQGDTASAYDFSNPVLTMTAQASVCIQACAVVISAVPALRTCLRGQAMAGPPTSGLDPSITSTPA